MLLTTKNSSILFILFLYLINYLFQIFKQLWEKRCRWLCCFFAGRDDQYLSAVSDIADILASEFHDLDLVPSDIAVGLILLQDEQEREQAEKRRNGEVSRTRLQNDSDSQ